MNTHADKTPENKNQTVANRLPKQKNHDESTFHFVDNRSEAVAQRKLQEAIDYSPRVQQFKTYQQIVNNSPQVYQLKTFKEGTIQLNGEGLRRRFPAPPEPEREPERDYNGPPLIDKIKAYLADAQARPAFYATKGLFGTISFIIGQIGLNVPKAAFNLIRGTPELVKNFEAMIANYKNGDSQNAAAEAATIASTIASIIETAIGTEGLISYSTTAAVYGSGAAKNKLKKD